jgi:hypothetical protein
MTRRFLMLAVLVPGLAFALKPVESAKPVSPGKGEFQAQLPPGWIYDTSRNAITAWHDGPLLNQIVVSIIPHKDAFKNAKRLSTPTTAPEDLAESYVANLQAGPAALHDVVVIASDPAELAGRPAFRVLLKYHAAEIESGAEMEICTLGVALDSGVMLATFRAPMIHFFERSLPDFEAAAKSIELIAPPPHK